MKAGLRLRMPKATAEPPDNIILRRDFAWLHSDDTPSYAAVILRLPPVLSPH